MDMIDTIRNKIVSGIEKENILLRQNDALKKAVLSLKNEVRILESEDRKFYENQTYDNIYEQVYEDISENIRNEAEQEGYDRAREDMTEELTEEIRRNLYDEIEEEVYDRANNELRPKIREEIMKDMYDAIYEEVRSSIIADVVAEESASAKQIWRAKVDSAYYKGLQDGARMHKNGEIIV